MLQRLANVAWWLGLSAYFGGMLALALAAPAIFGTAHSAGISMPGINAVALDMGNQAGGEVFGAVLNMFAYVEALALILMLPGLLTRLFDETPGAGRRGVAKLLTVLYVALAVLAAYDLGVLRPRVWSQRTLVRQTQATHVPPTTAPWPERDAFDSLHHESEDVGQAKFWILLAMLVLSAATERFAADTSASEKIRYEKSPLTSQKR